MHQTIPYTMNYSGLHTATRKTAMLQKTADPSVVKAQFDEFEHKHSHGWTEYPLSEFEMRDGRPFPSVIGPDSTSYPTHAVIYAHGILDGKTRELVWYLSTFTYRLLREKKSLRHPHITYKRDELAALLDGNKGWANTIIEHLTVNHQRSIKSFMGAA